MLDLLILEAINQEPLKASYQHCGKKYPYSEFLWSVFSCIRTEYGEIQSISLNSVRMRENTEQENSVYGHCHAMESKASDDLVQLSNSNSLHQRLVFIGGNTQKYD